MAKKKPPKGIPTGYETGSPTYELIVKTSYYKPYKEPKSSKRGLRTAKVKEYVQPVKIVSVKPGVMPKAGRGKRGK